MTLVDTRRRHRLVRRALRRAATPAPPAPSPSPGDAAYDALVSPWNLAVPVRPAAVLAARTAAGRRRGGPLRRRATACASPRRPPATAPIADLVGELLVTTAGLDECVVHPEGWARVGAGVKWLRVVEAAAPHGLAPLSGSITDVGIVGYTTGGGLGPMARTYGLATDRVRAIEVVTGDGVLRRVTPTEHPELFFGLRGGKGTLGIVTAIEFDLVHQPTFYGGSLWFDGADAATVIERWLHWSADAARAGHDVDRAVPAAGHARRAAGARRPARRCRSATCGPATPRRASAGSPTIRAAAPVLLDDVARQAVRRDRLGAHRPARPDAGVRGRRGADRLPRGGGATRCSP